MKNIVVDVDTGVDDAWGLFLLLAQKKEDINILGITCVNGNTNVDAVCRNTLYVLATAGRNNVPVFRGAERPLICTDGELSCGDLRHFFGLNGFGDVLLEENPNTEKPQEENAVAALNRIVSHNQGKVTLVCFGPLTNIALAIRTYPDFVENLKEIYVMGGNYTAMGNTTMTAEFNFHTDPEAANIVMTSAVDKLTLLPWETCYGLNIPYEWRMEEIGRGNSKAIELLNRIEEPVMARAKRLGLKYWTPCDQTLAAIVIHPDIVLDKFSLHATVELSGMYTRGQLVVDHLNKKRHNISCVKAVNQQNLQNLLLMVKHLN